MCFRTRSGQCNLGHTPGTAEVTVYGRTDARVEWLAKSAFVRRTGGVAAGPAKRPFYARI